MKKYILGLILSLCLSFTFAQRTNYQISNDKTYQSSTQKAPQLNVICKIIDEKTTAVYDTVAYLNNRIDSLGAEIDTIRLSLDSLRKPYKTYIALITQVSTNAPTVTVLENTLSGAISWAYTGVGIYTGTLTGEFTSNKTFTSPPSISTSLISSFATMTRGSANTIVIHTTNLAGTHANDILDKASIEIRVYE